MSETYSVISYRSQDLPEQYTAMVFSKWLRSLRFGNDWFKDIGSDAYYKHYHNYLGRLLSSPDSIIRLAVLSDNHDIALGFSVNRKEVLDYVHVHKDYRGKGIAKKLMPAGISTISHTTHMAKQIMSHNDKYKFIFNPFI